MYDPQLCRWHVIDPKTEKYNDYSPYSYCLNNPLIYIDPRGDTINFSDAFKNNKALMEWYNNWSNTKEGKKFVRLYDEGRKYGNVSVNFDIGDKGNSNITSIVDKETGIATPLNPGENYGEEGKKVAEGKSETQFLRSDIKIAPNMNSNYEKATGVKTIWEETTHMRINHFTLYNKGNILSSSQQHKLMDDPGRIYYQSGYSTFSELKKLWFPTFQSGVIKSVHTGLDMRIEKNFIKHHVTDHGYTDAY